MKIAVCVKRTPDTETRIKVAQDGRGIDETGVKFVLNPYDEYAVEEALKLKEAHDGEVVIVSLGVEGAQETIRTALAMGADRGVLLKVDAPLADPLVTAEVLTQVLRAEEGLDLILFGKLSIDDASQAVGVMVAELLELPCVSAVSSLDVDGGRATARREIEGGIEVMECDLPAVFTTDKGLNEPRYPALRGIMMAKKKPLEVQEIELRDGSIEVVSLELPAERKGGRIVGEGPDAVPALVEALRTEAKVI